MCLYLLANPSLIRLLVTQIIYACPRFVFSALSNAIAGILTDVGLDNTVKILPEDALQTAAIDILAMASVVTLGFMFSMVFLLHVSTWGGLVGAH